MAGFATRSQQIHRQALHHRRTQLHRCAPHSQPTLSSAAVSAMVSITPCTADLSRSNAAHANLDAWMRCAFLICSWTALLSPARLGSPQVTTDPSSITASKIRIQLHGCAAHPSAAPGRRCGIRYGQHRPMSQRIPAGCCSTTPQSPQLPQSSMPQVTTEQSQCSAANTLTVARKSLPETTAKSRLAPCQTQRPAARQKRPMMYFTRKGEFKNPVERKSLLQGTINAPCPGAIFKVQ